MERRVRKTYQGKWSFIYIIINKQYLYKWSRAGERVKEEGLAR
jgi:hypothetical protein